MRVSIVLSLALALSANSPAPQGLLIPDGTRVRVRLLQAISSETSHTGDPINLEVAEDVVVDGTVVLKQGTPVKGTIVEAEPKKRMGRAGRLVFAISETRAASRETIRLRSTQTKEGDSHVTGVVVTTAVTAALLWPAAPFMLLRHGKSIGSPAGTAFEAFVDGDHALRNMSLRADATETAAAATSTSNAEKPLSNRDVMALTKAGIGDAIIVAKIRSSKCEFNLDTDDLVLLKQSAVSDTVIAAMLESKSATGAPVPTKTPPAPPSTLRNAEPTLLGSWTTNVPSVTAEATALGDIVTLTFTGGDLEHLSVPLTRVNGDQYSGEFGTARCAVRGQLQLHRVPVGWQGWIQRAQCAKGGSAPIRTGLVLRRANEGAQ